MAKRLKAFAYAAKLEEQRKVKAAVAVVEAEMTRELLDNKAHLDKELAEIEICLDAATATTV